MCAPSVSEKVPGRRLIIRREDKTQRKFKRRHLVYALEIAKFPFSKFEEQGKLQPKNPQMEGIGVLKIKKVRQKV